MKVASYILLFWVFVLQNVFAQQERSHIRHGVRDYQKSDYGNAEVNFRKALEENQKSFEALYNTGNALYKQDKAEDAAAVYKDLLDSEADKNRKADLYYNLGNSLMKNQDYKGSIGAYQNALRINPNDEDARYNLAYALSKIQEQQNQQNQDENNDENQDENQNENKDSDDQENQPENQNKEDKSPQEKPGISREEAEKILKALEDREKEVKAEADKKRAKAISVPTEKDW
jgi:Ca-activated chloride channel homolog